VAGSFLLFASRLLWKLFPEAGMVANSQVSVRPSADDDWVEPYRSVCVQCKNRFASWDGKLMNVQVLTVWLLRTVSFDFGGSNCRYGIVHLTTGLRSDLSGLI
jgi:hypothetical protein